MGLERMDDEWTKLLSEMKEHGNSVSLEPELSRTLYERITAYFVYRHFAAAKDPEDAVRRLKFAFLSTMTVCCLSILHPGCDALRLYSAEIEYSDVNVERILADLI